MKKVVSIDLDNVIFNNKELMIPIFKKHGYEYFPPKDWEMSEYPEEVRNELFKLFKDPKFAEQPLIEKDIRYKLHEIDKIYNIKFVSNRYERIFLDTFKQLLFQFPDFFTIEKLIFAISKKSNVLKKYDLEMHFDDSPYVIEDLKENNLNVTMVSNDDTPYNHHLRGSVNYVSKLSEGLDQLLLKNSR